MNKALREQINKLIQKTYYGEKFDPSFLPGIVDKILALITARDKRLAEKIEEANKQFQLNCSVYKAYGALNHDIYAGCDCGIYNEALDKTIQLIREGEEK